MIEARNAARLPRIIPTSFPHHVENPVEIVCKQQDFPLFLKHQNAKKAFVSSRWRKSLFHIFPIFPSCWKQKIFSFSESENFLCWKRFQIPLWIRCGKKRRFSDCAKTMHFSWKNRKCKRSFPQLLRFRITAFSKEKNTKKARFSAKRNPFPQFQHPLLLLLL